MSASASAEAAWLENGTRLWKRTYRVKPNSDDYAWDTVDELITSGAIINHAFDALANENQRRLFQIGDCLWCAKWADGGARTVCADEKYLSAAAATRLTKDAAGDISLPWPAFLVRLPHGLFPTGYRGETTWLSHVRLMQARDIRLRDGTIRQRAIIEYFSNSYPCAVAREDDGSNLADALFDMREVEEIENRHELEGQIDFDVQMRSAMMVKRAIVGLLFALQHTNNWKERDSKLRRQGERRDGPPVHRTIVVGAPISVDVRAAVRDGCLYGSRIPAFQSLVRGHYKRQVIGIGRTGRKVIWIEPFWRGPEDAPILARPYRVGPKDVEA